MSKENNIPGTIIQNQGTTAKLQIFRKALATYITGPIISVLEKTSISPNAVTLFGFVLILAAAALAGTGHLFAAGWMVLLASFFDMLDGALARRTNQVTRFGAVLDSTLDRLSEAAVLIGIMAYFLFDFNPVPYKPWVILLIGITMISSFLVSYVRARAEAHNIECQVGIFTRAERVIILALGLLISGVPYVLAIALAIITLLSIVSVSQRLLCVYQQTQKGRTG